MKMLIIAIGTNLPKWVNEGITPYLKRIQSIPGFDIDIKEISAKKRTKNINISKITEQESNALIQSVPNNYIPIALDVGGKSLSSEQLANKLDVFNKYGDNIAILIGGPEGFNDNVRIYSRERWSLSNLTLPHPIARIFLAETLYRSISILNNHPYHRGD